jgi:hypothetical protein
MPALRSDISNAALHALQQPYSDESSDLMTGSYHLESGWSFGQSAPAAAVIKRPEDLAAGYDGQIEWWQ